MAVKLIRPETISFRATVTEDELRQRMAHEVLEQIGGLGPDGRRLPGDGRAGGYTIDVSGPAPARILLPREGE